MSRLNDRTAATLRVDADGAPAGNEGAEVIIYQPAPTVMQAGRRLTHQWVLEFAPHEKERLDPMMGWAGSGDTRQEVVLHFPTRKAAEAFATAHGLTYVVAAPHDPCPRPKSYAENFRPDRLVPWSH